MKVHPVHKVQVWISEHMNPFNGRVITGYGDSLTGLPTEGEWRQIGAKLRRFIQWRITVIEAQ